MYKHLKVSNGTHIIAICSPSHYIYSMFEAYICRFCSCSAIRDIIPSRVVESTNGQVTELRRNGSSGITGSTGWKFAKLCLILIVERPHYIVSLLHSGIEVCCRYLLTLCSRINRLTNSIFQRIEPIALSTRILHICTQRHLCICVLCTEHDTLVVLKSQVSSPAGIT